MNLTRSLAATACTIIGLAIAPFALAEDHPAEIHVHDVYARAGGMGKSGAVFFMMHNMTETDDRLIDARAEVAKKVELHTHKDMGDGVMKMMHVPEGFPLPAGEMHELARGGDHVMLMGLTADLKNGDHFPLTLIFEQAGEITVDAIVDNDRQPMGGMMMKPGSEGGTMGHGNGMQSGG